MSYVEDALDEVLGLATRGGDLDTYAPEVVGVEMAIVTRYTNGSFQVWIRHPFKPEWIPGPFFNEP